MVLTLVRCDPWAQATEGHFPALLDETLGRFEVGRLDAGARQPRTITGDLPAPPEAAYVVPPGTPAGSTRVAAYVPLLYQDQDGQPGLAPEDAPFGLLPTVWLVHALGAPPAGGAGPFGIPAEGWHQVDASAGTAQAARVVGWQDNVRLSTDLVPHLEVPAGGSISKDLGVAWPDNIAERPMEVGLVAGTAVLTCLPFEPLGLSTTWELFLPDLRDAEYDAHVRVGDEHERIVGRFTLFQEGDQDHDIGGAADTCLTAEARVIDGFVRRASPALLYDRITLGHNLTRRSEGGQFTRLPIGTAVDLVWTGSSNCPPQ